MIIIGLKGGLGNQIFQYATGRAIAIRNGDQIKLDVTEYNKHNNTDTIRQYSLSSFAINTEIATAEEIKKLKYPFGIISKSWRYFKAKILRQFYVNFVPSILNKKSSLYLDGFFQSEKYFIDYEKQIRQDLTLKNPFSPMAQEISNTITNTINSISLHVRRGDYVQDPRTNQYHGTCSPEYYSRALELIKSKLDENINVFIFSDDIAWVKENMPLAYPITYVSNPDIKDFEELILMSQCDHHIIANSSFSWWGAWLNPQKDKIIIAPKKWTTQKNSSHRDLLPPSWISL